MALFRFLDGKQRGKTFTVDDAVIDAEGGYRFKKRSSPGMVGGPTA